MTVHTLSLDIAIIGAGGAGLRAAKVARCGFADLTSLPSLWLITRL